MRGHGRGTKRGTRRGRAAGALLGVCALLLTACGSDTDGGSTAPGEATTQPDLQAGTLRFSNWQWLVAGRGEDLWDAVSGYSDQNPGATLEQVAVPFNEYADQLFTEFGAGVAPDIFIVGDTQFFALADEGLLEPLDDVISDLDLNESNDAMIVDGQQLGVTWEQVPYGLIGNRNLMEEAGIAELPTTIDELIVAGEAIQENTDADGFAVRHRIAEFAGWAADFQNWPHGFGGGWSDGDQLTIDSDANVEAVTAFQQVYDSGIMPIGDDASTFRDKFRQESLGFIIDNAGAALSFTTGGVITGQDMVAGALPFPEPGVHEKLILAVNPNGENTDLAKDFVRWFLSEEGQGRIRGPHGASTLATDLALPASFVEANPWADAYIEIGASTNASLIQGFEIETLEYFQVIMEAVERVVTEGQDPREALGQAQQELE